MILYKIPKTNIRDRLNYFVAYTANIMVLLSTTEYSDKNFVDTDSELGYHITYFITNKEFIKKYKSVTFFFPIDIAKYFTIEKFERDWVAAQEKNLTEKFYHKKLVQEKEYWNSRCKATYNLISYQSSKKIKSYTYFKKLYKKYCNKNISYDELVNKTTNERYSKTKNH